jgi:hypothetical protein
MESIKVGSTLRINAGRGERGLLWRPQFFDRALRSVKEYYEKVEYTHLNPVRAGLVKRAEDGGGRACMIARQAWAQPLGRIALWPATAYCCRPMSGDELEGKAAESPKNETPR